jgi:arylsulfatase
MERYKRQMGMNLFGKPFPLTPRNPKIPLWSSLSQEQQDKSDHIMAIYAAVIDRLDQSIGRLVNELKAKGVYDNTFIILLSDNGGNAEGGTLGKYTGTNPGDYASDIWIGHAWAELSRSGNYSTLIKTEQKCRM